MHESIMLRQQYQVAIEKLFMLLSTPKYMEQWFSPDSSIEIKVLQHDFTVGGEYQLQYTQPSGAVNIVQGVFTRIEQPGIISFTWEWDESDSHGGIATAVTWQLKQKGLETELTVIHEQIPDQAFYQRHKNGWLATLNRITNI